MSFSPVKPGGWAFGELLTSAQMNALDADHANAIDGNQGGSYTLAAPLSIDGDTVTIDQLTAPNISGVTTFDSDVVVADDVLVGGDLTAPSILGDTTFSANVGVTATLTADVIHAALAFFNLPASAPVAAHETVDEDSNPIRSYATTGTIYVTTLTAGMPNGKWFWLKVTGAGERTVHDNDTGNNFATVPAGGWAFIIKIAGTWQLIGSGLP
jgi:hypothetical protein